MKRKRILFSLLALLLAVLIPALLLWNGVILLNNPDRDAYPVRGVDVSAYQGGIDWAVLAQQGIDFAYIKATEGSSYVDECFAYNYENALNTELRVGAYHFFSFDSEGARQAEHFIRTVKPCADMLPPVVDLEFYGDKAKSPPEKSAVLSELDPFIERIEAHYGMKPVIYATKASYDLYLAGEYADCDIWIRDVITTPSLSDGRAWTFWQYTNRATLDGYSGAERYIDMNVFFGTTEEFARYPNG